MQDALPFIGPKKGALLQKLVRDKQPRMAVEVGTLCGYSTLLIAQAMLPDAQLVSLESDWKWALVAKRFVYQATTGDRSSKAVGFLLISCWISCQMNVIIHTFKYADTL